MFVESSNSSLQSIGYKSAEMSKSEENSLDNCWKFSSNKTAENLEMKPVPIRNGSNEDKAGPFLTLLLQKLNNYLSNSFYVNLHLTGLISRLAIFPQALLRTYLLDHSLVLQPDVPSLFQVSCETCRLFLINFFIANP